jgi:hypothetical protein
MTHIQHIFLLIVALFFDSLAQAGQTFLQGFKSTALGRDYKYTVYIPNS